MVFFVSNRLFCNGIFLFFLRRQVYLQAENERRHYGRKVFATDLTTKRRETVDVFELAVAPRGIEMEVSTA
jgi:hypothetical protein